MGEGSERGRSPRRAITQPTLPPAGNSTSNYSSYAPRTRIWPASRERSELRGVAGGRSRRSVEELVLERRDAGEASVGRDDARFLNRPQRRRARRRSGAFSLLGGSFRRSTSTAPQGTPTAQFLHVQLLNEDWAGRKIKFRAARAARTLGCPSARARTLHVHSCTCWARRISAGPAPRPTRATPCRGRAPAMGVG